MHYFMRYFSNLEHTAYYKAKNQKLQSNETSAW